MSFRLFDPSVLPDAQPLFVIQYGGEFENASRIAFALSATIRCRIARWFASAFQSQVPDDGSKLGMFLYCPMCVCVGSSPPPML